LNDFECAGVIDGPMKENEPEKDIEKLSRRVTRSMNINGHSPQTPQTGSKQKDKYYQLEIHKRIRGLSNEGPYEAKHDVFSFGLLIKDVGRFQIDVPDNLKELAERIEEGFITTAESLLTELKEIKKMAQSNEP